MAGYDGTQLENETELAQGDIAAGDWLDVTDTSAGLTKKLDADALAWTNKNSTLIDNVRLNFGTDTDAYLMHDDTDWYIINKKGDLILRHNAAVGDGDILIDNNCNGFRTLFTNENAGGVDKGLLTLDPDRETAKVMGLEGTSVTISADTDNQDALGVSIIYIDTSGGNVIIGGLANGVTGQIILMRKINAANTATIEHNEGTGTQKFFTHDTVDISLANYGGPMIVFDGTQWQAGGY